METLLTMTFKEDAVDTCVHTLNTLKGTIVWATEYKGTFPILFQIDEVNDEDGVLSLTGLAVDNLTGLAETARVITIIPSNIEVI
jgi:hypothetical protein